VKPDPARVLETVSMMLIMEFVPQLGSSDAQQALAGGATIRAVAREEIDRAAARRIEENRALRRLFAAAREVVSDTELAARLTEAAASEEGSFLVSDLDRSNQALRALLIRLHVHVEQVPGDAARRVEAAIWDELRASTERRRTMLGNF
jgi:FKBP-type peptidyl-prolyl cis-trans isomerase (trigger factor)